MLLSSTNYLPALLARLSAKLAIAIAKAKKLMFALAPNQDLYYGNKPKLLPGL